ncbi:unnamed protein product [Haemonchus placei]|uniref:Protein of unassigned function n=1 Tax=Haemonchus placei TaxID=6290 RepID=A0A0N4X146_HAEPC|nr:unnamed protein product [Haemonchus placei]
MAPTKQVNAGPRQPPTPKPVWKRIYADVVRSRHDGSAEDVGHRIELDCSLAPVPTMIELIAHCFGPDAIWR